MYIFWNLMILATVYYIFDYLADFTFMGFSRTMVSLIIVWAFGTYFHLETSYFPLIGVGVYFIAFPIHKVINYFLKHQLSSSEDSGV